MKKSAFFQSEKAHLVSEAGDAEIKTSSPAGGMLARLGLGDGRDE